MTSRRIRILLVLTAAAAGATAAGTAWWRAERVLSSLQDRPDGSGEYPIDFSPAVELARPPERALASATATGELRDGGRAGGHELLATAGGLLVGGLGPRRRALTTLDGLAGVELSAAAALGERLVLGDAEGGLSLVDGERAVAIRVRLPRAGAVVDLASAGSVVYVLFAGVGVIAFDGRRAVDVARGDRALAAGLSDATAIAFGRSGLAVGTRTGAIFEEREGGLARRDEAVPGGPITALATDGGNGSLYAGTPFGLYAVERGAARPLARDLFVTTILPVDGALFVGTFDDGVRVVDPGSGRERARHLSGHRIRRLRILDGRVVAFAPGGPYRYTGGGFVADPPAPDRALAGPHVTALARDGAGAIWVGTFEHGIDVLGPDLRTLRHLPEGPGGAIDARDDQLNALTFHAPSGAMIAATVHGALRYSPSGPRAIPLDDASGGASAAAPDAIAAIALTRSGLAFAGGRGVHLADDGRIRTLYAFHGLANNHVYALAVAATPGGERLYAGTLAGVSLIDLPSPGELDAPRVVATVGAGSGGLRAGWVTALAAAPEGVYAGTYGGGVQLLRDGILPGGRVTVDDVSARAGSFHVNPGALSLVGDTLFIGTLERGLLAFDRSGRAFRHLPIASRLLPSQNVTALLPDGDALLVGTAAGLVRIPRSLLDETLIPFHPEGTS